MQLIENRDVGSRATSWPGAGNNMQYVVPSSQVRRNTSPIFTSTLANHLRRNDQ